MIATLAPAKPKPLTAEDLLRLDSKGVKGELIRGEFCETVSAGLKHGEVASNFVGELGNFVRPRRLGRVIGTDTGVLPRTRPGYRPRSPTSCSSRRSACRLAVRPDGYSEIIPDIVVDVKSPSDSRRGSPRQSPHVARLRRPASMGGVPGDANDRRPPRRRLHNHPVRRRHPRRRRNPARIRRTRKGYIRALARRGVR